MPKNEKNSQRLRLIIPGCGNIIHGVGTCGVDGNHCEPCRRDAITMTEETIRKHKFNPESYPLAKPV